MVKEEEKKKKVLNLISYDNKTNILTINIYLYKTNINCFYATFNFTFLISPKLLFKPSMDFII